MRKINKKEKIISKKIKKKQKSKKHKKKWVFGNLYAHVSQNQKEKNQKSKKIKPTNLKVKLLT